MKKLLLFLAVAILLFISLLIYVLISARIPDPEIDLGNYKENQVLHSEQNFWRTDGGWMQKNPDGIYELYVEGSPGELGTRRGLLVKDLIYTQEKLFIDRIRELVPSEFYLLSLKEIVS